MSEDEAIEILKHVNIVRKFSGIYSSTETIHEAIETILAELEKKDKIINLMAESILNYDTQLVINYYRDKNEVIRRFMEVKDETII